MKFTRSPIVPVLAALLVSACAQSTDTGGGAGDTDVDQDAIALITPLVGLYDLPDNWAGLPLNEAYLEIQQPSDEGVATSLVHRLDSTNNCFEPRPATGRVTKDPIFDRVFLDSFDFGSAVIAKSGSQLVISLTEDVQDIDDDGNFDEPAELSAIQLDFMIVDLGNTCQ